MHKILITIFLFLTLSTFAQKQVTKSQNFIVPSDAINSDYVGVVLPYANIDTTVYTKLEE